MRGRRRRTATSSGRRMLIAGLPYDSLDKMRGKLKGAIVMTQPLMTTFIREDRVNPTAPTRRLRRRPRPDAVGAAEAVAAGQT